MLPFFEQKLLALEKIQQKRTLSRHFERLAGKFIYYNNKKLIHFSTNDYLGLSQKIIAKKTKEYLSSSEHFGNCSSRLVAGNHLLFQKLEKKISHWQGMPETLIFNSGYQANIGVLPALKDKMSNTIYFFDKLSHASLIDGILLSQSKWVSFKHNDTADLRQKIKKYQHWQHKIIVTEAVFSMNGDIAPLKNLIKIAKESKAIFYIDQAHATGIFGKAGEGFSKLYDFYQYPNVISMATMGKALGGFGAYVCCHKTIKDYLINFCRSFIFSTALPQPILKATAAAIELLQNDANYQDNKAGKTILALAQYCQEKFIDSGIPHLKSDSHILAILTKDNDTTEKLSCWLGEKGFYAIGIRPPTVPKNQARIRLVINLFITRKDIDGLVKELVIFFKKENQQKSSIQ